MNRLFVLTLNVNDNRIGHSRYFLPTSKVEDYNVMIDGKAFLIIWKITTGQEDEYTTGCVLDYNFFNKHYKMIALDLSKQQELDVNPIAIQQSNFIGNLSGSNNRGMFYITEEEKETILDFSQGTAKVLLFCFVLIQ